MMHDDKMRETRAKLQNELQQIAEHSGEITADMADRFDALEADIRELDGKIRDADIRDRFDSIKAEPTSNASHLAQVKPPTAATPGELSSRTGVPAVALQSRGEFSTP